MHPVFIIVTAVIGLMSARVMLKNFSKNNTNMNAHAPIGNEYILLKPIGFNKPGQIKIKGVTWNVITENPDEILDEGAVVKIIALSGNKYVVKKV